MYSDALTDHACDNSSVKHARMVVSLAFVPAVLALVGTALIDGRSGDIGLAAAPFIVVAYLIGLVLCSVLRLILHQRWCFGIAVTAVALCLLGVTQRSNIVSWLLVPALGDLVASFPDVWLPRFMQESPG